jgi:ParB family chromosome partitioning protein
MQITLLESRHKAEMVLVADIVVMPPRRQVDTAKVVMMSESIARVGLLNPITVREEADTDSLILVCGLHRLEAFRHLQRDRIPASIMPASTIKTEVRMMEIAENLHRAELTELERAEQINEWRELAKVRKLSAPSNNQPAESGVRETARELGVDEKAVRNASKIASIARAAKQAARNAGIDDNQSKLLKVAAAPAEQQVATVEKIKQFKRDAKINKAEPPLTADEETAITIFKEAVAGLVALNKKYVTQDSVAGFLVDVVSAKDTRAVAQLIYAVETQIEERERAAEKAKRIVREAKNPTKAYEKARAKAIDDAMEYDMEEARTEARENGESWGEIKDEWIEEWTADNWGDAQQAEFDANFRKNWKEDHGIEFPEPPTKPLLAELAEAGR